MTTPHAPEGGARELPPDIVAAMVALPLDDYSIETGAAQESEERLRVAIRAAITAARAEGATAERARLAGMATEHEWDLVIELADATRDCMAEWAGVQDAKRLGAAKESLFAAFAAQRERVVGECVKVVDGYSLPFPDAVHNGERQNEIVADMCADLRALLAAPTKGEGE